MRELSGRTRTRAVRRAERTPARPRMRRTTRTGFAAGALVCAVLLTGCSQEYYDERGKADSPVKSRAGEDSAAEVYNFPDGFGNLATKCVADGKRAYATTRFFGTTHGDETVTVPANAVIVDDPGCTAP